VKMRKKIILKMSRCWTPNDFHYMDKTVETFIKILCTAFCRRNSDRFGM